MVGVKTCDVSLFCNYCVLSDVFSLFYVNGELRRFYTEDNPGIVSNPTSGMHCNPAYACKLHQ